jgi:hypothetical protein
MIDYRDRTTPLMTAWVELSEHARACSQCREAVGETRSTPEQPEQHYDALCPAGQPLFTTWWESAQVVLQNSELRTHRHRMGLDRTGINVQLRIEVLASVPGDAWKRLCEIEDDELREAEIQALEAAYRAHSSVIVPMIPPDGSPGPAERRCAICGQPMSKNTNAKFDRHYECSRRAKR